MKILLDECLPKDLKYDIIGHEASTVGEMGWAGIKNGQLLTLAEQRFDVFLTADRSIQYQQNLRARSIALVVLNASDNKQETLRPLIPAFLELAHKLEAGSVTNVVHELG